MGIAGRSLNLSITHAKMKGLKDRLDSHWRGRRSGDQFSVYVFDRFIVPVLTEEQRKQFANGDLQGSPLTREFIRTHLSYRFVVTASYEEARAVEVVFAKGQTPAGFPVLNPRRIKRATAQ